MAISCLLAAGFAWRNSGFCAIAFKLAPTDASTPMSIFVFLSVRRAPGCAGIRVSFYLALLVLASSRNAQCSDLRRLPAGPSRLCLVQYCKWLYICGGCPRISGCWFEQQPCNCNAHRGAVVALRPGQRPLKGRPRGRRSTSGDSATWGRATTTRKTKTGHPRAQSPPSNAPAGGLRRCAAARQAPRAPRMSPRSRCELAVCGVGMAVTEKTARSRAARISEGPFRHVLGGG